MNQVEIEISQFPVTILIRGDVYDSAHPGPGSVPTGELLPKAHLIRIAPNSPGLIMLDIQNTEDIDMLIDKLLDHRKIIKP